MLIGERVWEIFLDSRWCGKREKGGSADLYKGVAVMLGSCPGGLGGERSGRWEKEVEVTGFM